MQIFGLDCAEGCLWLDDGVIAVIEELLTPPDSIFAGGEGANAHVDEVIRGLAARCDGVAVLAESADQDLRVINVGDCGDLDHEWNRRGKGGLGGLRRGLDGWRVGRGSEGRMDLRLAGRGGRSG